MSGSTIARDLYLKVFLSLMVLTVLTVTVSFMDLGALNTLVALAIALVKAYLVIIFFMHVKSADSLTRLFVAAGFLWLVIMIVLTLSDFYSRSWEVTHA